MKKINKENMSQTFAVFQTLDSLKHNKFYHKLIPLIILNTSKTQIQMKI